MGYYKYLKKLWKKPKENFNKLLGGTAWRDKLAEFRKQPAMLR
ncbi:50S ribosomal protein L15e, partial [Candidatus Woesearchaeota archaeon]|nr:50S ribosomal protein L15e [Candidatus Woesearchaeota archaeon]